MLNHLFKTSNYINCQRDIAFSIIQETVTPLLTVVLASCGEDKRLGFLDGNGKVAHIIKKAHPAPINRCKFINDHILVSGDDEGLTKVWDLRTVVPVFQAENQS
jgi:WD40 repeat protein